MYDKQLHNKWIASARNSVERMNVEKATKSEGQLMPVWKTIFGTGFPPESRMLARSAYEKATLKACKARAKEPIQDANDDEAEIRFLRSVKAVRSDFQKKAIPKSAPRFRKASEAIVRAAVAQKLAMAKRSMPKKKGCESGAAVPSQAEIARASDKQNVDATFWCADAVSLSNDLPGLRDYIWSVVDKLAAASHAYIPSVNCSEASSQSVAALHCNLHGKQLLSLG